MEFKWNLLIWLTMLFPKVKYHLKKIPISGMRKLSNWWLRLSNRFPKHYRILLLPLIPPTQRQMVNCYYRRYCVLEMQRSEAPGMEITWTPPWWKLSFLVWEGSIKTLKWGENEQSYPAMTLMTRIMTSKACTSSMDTYFVANTL